MPQNKNSITPKSARERLKPRREPYWARVVKGGYVGFHKSTYCGTWVARWRTANNKQLTQLLQMDTEAVDPADQFDEAKKLAQLPTAYLHVKENGQPWGGPSNSGP